MLELPVLEHATTESVAELLEQSEQLERRGQRETARDVLRAAAMVAPHVQDVWHALAASHERAGELDTAHVVRAVGQALAAVADPPIEEGVPS